MLKTFAESGSTLKSLLLWFLATHLTGAVIKVYSSTFINALFKTALTNQMCRFEEPPAIKKQNRD